jgi:hypothetical protein
MRQGRRRLAAAFLCSALAGSAPAVEPGPAADVSAQAARDAFARIKGLAGRWRGASTRGWTDEVRIRAIAGGSAVVEDGGGAAEGPGGAHPGEEMMTVFYLDGDRLMLTHYCVARNHPRLVAREFADGGRTVVFGFLDAANLASRDQGHMDAMVLRFLGSDRFATRWTWYAQGAEKWMEDIERVRVTDRAR